MLPLRPVLVALALAVAALLLIRLDGHNACEDARERVFLVGMGRDPSTAARLARELVADCRDSAVIVAGALRVARAGAPGPARRMLERVVAREPENAPAWAALARLAEADDPARARTARERAARLNPRAAAGR